MADKIVVFDSNVQPSIGAHTVGAVRQIFDSIRKAMASAFVDHDLISAQEVGAIFEVFEKRWGDIDRFFQNCTVNTLGSFSFVQQDRRKDQLTRLLFARILVSIPDRQLADSELTYPRVIITGIQRVLAGMFNAQELKMLNQNARWVFEFIGGDSDQLIMSHLEQSDVIRFVAEPVFILLLFYHFNIKRAEAIRIINDSVPGEFIKIGDPEFCDFFEAIFTDIYKVLRKKDGRTRIEMTHGEDFLIRVRGILDQYQRYKEGVSPSMPTRHHA